MPTVYLDKEEIMHLNQRFNVGTTIINEGNLEGAVKGPKEGFGGVDIYITLAEKAAVMTFRLSQGHPFNDANKRTASAALERFVKKNRNGKGLTGNSTFIVGQCADNYPMTLQEFTVAVRKLIPPPGPGELA